MEEWPYEKICQSVDPCSGGIGLPAGISQLRKRGADDFPAGEPVVIKIDSGEVRSITGLEVTRELSRDDGIYADLYVENNGPNPVAASINGQNERTFQAGEKGHIRLEVTRTFWGGDREYTFKAVPGANGGSVSLCYEIIQGGEEALPFS